jgi:hypothetical protein
MRASGTHPIHGPPARLASTDRDQVDAVPRRHPAVRPLSCFQKTRMPSPRRQQPIYQGPRASCDTRPVRDRPSRRIAPARTGLGEAANRESCDRDVWTRTGWMVQDTRDPWQRGRCRREDGIRVFWGEAEWWRRRWMSVLAHHPHDRAIGKSVPAPESRMKRQDGRTTRVSERGTVDPSVGVRNPSRDGPGGASLRKTQPPTACIPSTRGRLSRAGEEVYIMCAAGAARAPHSADEPS